MKDGRRISALVRCTLGCVRRGLLRPYNLAHNIRSHAEQTDDRKQVHEKAHEGTLLVSGTTKLMRGGENNRDPGHICGGSQNDWRAIWPREAYGQAGRCADMLKAQVPTTMVLPSPHAFAGEEKPLCAPLPLHIDPGYNSNRARAAASSHSGGCRERARSAGCAGSA